ncbi:hypothetical protein DPMN_161018 [Dreissena polymorpha]|uniref:Uncharacterized protein n=1 Tax=Dreissena polymorpha TaxID=45954 RepID=A0A9D4ES98_DREPO|nr:hypothetical protein DPMN_161018 [Dreissena polymorpha]
MRAREALPHWRHDSHTHGYDCGPGYVYTGCGCPENTTMAPDGQCVSPGECPCQYGTECGSSKRTTTAQEAAGRRATRTTRRLTDATIPSRACAPTRLFVTPLPVERLTSPFRTCRAVRRDEVRRNFGYRTNGEY